MSGLAALVTVLASVAGAASQLVAARVAYGLLRAKKIDGYRAYPNWYPDPVHEFETSIDQWETVGTALLTGVFWPLVLLGWGVFGGMYRFITGSRRRSAFELEQERARLDRRVRDLERDLGIEDRR